MAIDHPPTDEVTLDALLHALADPTRRAILQQIEAEQPIACAEVAPTLPRSTVSVHLRTLREAGLIRQERQGQLICNRARADGALSVYPEVVAAIMGASA